MTRHYLHSRRERKEPQKIMPALSNMHLGVSQSLLNKHWQRSKLHVRQLCLVLIVLSFLFFKGFTRLAAQAVSIVISKLPTVIACLPPPIKYFFFLSERKMPKTCFESKKAGLLAWILIVIICQIFEDGNITELLIGTTLDRWSKEKLSLVRVCLESIMGKKKSSPKQVTQKIIWSIEQQRPNWIENQLLKARKLSIDW